MNLFPPNQPGLHRRLILTLLLPLTVIFTIGVFFDYRLAQQTAAIAYDQSLADAALDIAAHLKSRASSEMIALSTEAEAMLRNDSSDQVYFSVRNASGQLLAGDAEVPLLAVESPALTYVDAIISDRKTRAATLQVTHASGALRVTVAETLTKRDRASDRILTAMILPNIFVVISAYGVVLLGVRFGLKPLRQIETEIGARSPRDLRELDATMAPRELRPLLRRLNELFEQLRLASAGQQRFLADAAHQLRTPLAGLQAQLDLADAEGSFPVNADRLTRIHDSIERISHLANQLLTYSRAESSASMAQDRVKVDLREIAEHSASVFIDRALAKGIDLGFDLEPASTSGVPWMLREALANMIDNAIRYTPNNSVITVLSGHRDGFPFVEVIDNGPGISVELRELALERFYRIPGSGGDGCGLGLAIVREVADVHGAVVQLSGVEGGGLRITLVFPRAVAET